jgi:hypothetical protein
MLWPTICIDNFFNNPEQVIKFSKTLKYEKSHDGKWPGERSNMINILDKGFINTTTKKIMAVLFPVNYKNMTWNLELYFQKINGKLYKNKGWVHNDAPQEFTAIIYLSNHKECGTSLYVPKNFFSDSINGNFKEKYYMNIEEQIDVNKYLDENNNRFEKTLTINSKFNRLIIFDSNNFHAAEQFNEESIEEERLTLICFFTNISGNINKYPISEMRRIEI